MKNIKIKCNGCGNSIFISPDIANQSKINIKIFGDNNKVIINTREAVNLDVLIGGKEVKTNHASFCVGENTQINGLFCLLDEDKSSITIGRNCLLSWNIEMWRSDLHSIYDFDGNVLNVGKEIIIGDNVWIGKDVHIAKNSRILNNSVVGWCSNVVGNFGEENVIIAGNPAKIVKRNIIWKKESVNSLKKDLLVK